MCFLPKSHRKSNCVTTLLAGIMLITLDACGCGLPCPAPWLLDDGAPTDYETQVDSIVQLVESEDPNGWTLEAAAGVCGDDGPRFIVSFTGPFSWRYDYFDRDTGEFLGRYESGSEILGFMPCHAQYWPTPIFCPDAVITETFGEVFNVGDDASVLPSMPGNSLCL